MRAEVKGTVEGISDVRCYDPKLRRLIAFFRLLVANLKAGDSTFSNKEARIHGLRLNWVIHLLID